MPILGNTLIPCESSDTECLKTLLKNVNNDITENGVPELEIPKRDVVEMHDIVIEESNVIQLNVTRGVLEGLNTCIFVDAK